MPSSDFDYHDHCAHDHEITMSSRTDMSSSRSSAPSSSSRFSMPTSDVPIMKCSPRIEIISESASITSSAIGAFLSSAASEYDDGGVYDQSLPDFALSELEVEERGHKAAFELDLDFLHTGDSSPSSFFDEDESDSYSSVFDDDIIPTSPLYGTAFYSLIDDAYPGDFNKDVADGLRFNSMLSLMEISPRNTPRSPRCPDSTKRLRM